MLRRISRRAIRPLSAAACETLERRVLLSLMPIGPEFRVNTYTPSTQSNAAMAADADGNFVVVWQSMQEGPGGTGVYGQRYDASGVPQGGEFHVNAVTTGTQANAAVAMDADGDFVVAWTSTDAATGGVLFQRYNSAGVPQGGQIRQVSSGGAPAVGMDAAGNFVVAWQQFEGGSQSWSIFAQRYSAAGASQGSAARVNLYTPGVQVNPSVAMNASGEFVVAWESNLQDGSDYGVYARRFDAAGVPQNFELQAAETTPGPQRDPAVVIDDDGDVVIVWSGSGIGGETDGVFFRPFRADGTQGNERRANSYTADSQSEPAIASDAAGGFLISWTSFGQDGSQAGVYTQQFDPAGDPLNSEFRVNTFTTQDQADPAVAASDDGNFIVAWSSELQDGSGGGTGVYAQRYVAVPDTVGPLVTGVFIRNVAVEPYTVHAPGADTLIVSFSENVTNVTDLANWVLTRGGTDISSQITSATFAFNITTNRHEGTLILAAPLMNGNYGLIARDTLVDVAGNALDGDADGAPGGSFAGAFSIAGIAPAGGEFQVNTFTTNFQQYPQVATDAAGNFIVAWTSEGQDGSDAGVYARRYNARGVPQGEEFRVNTTTAGPQENPAVAMDSDGDFVIAWQNGGQTVQGIYAQRYGANGVPHGGEFLVSSGIESSLISPRVAMDRDGDFVVAWTNYVSFNATDVYARRYSASGVSQGGAFLVNTYTPDNQTTYGVAMNDVGDFVIVWSSMGQDGSSLGVYAQRFSAAGVAQGEEFRANTYTTSLQAVGGVAMDATGNFTITWTSDGQDGSNLGAYARRFTADGVPKGLEFQVNSSTASNQMNPSISMDDDGESVIVWTSYEQDGLRKNTYARRYNAAGAPVGGEFRVNTQTSTEGVFPSVALDEDGEFIVVWNNAEVLGRHYVLPATPTVGTLTDTPDPVSAGGILTLSASDVTDDGTVTGVSFYSEANGIEGLQVGFQGDTLVGTTNSQTGGVWAVDVPTTGLAPGTYTYWAQATDDANLVGSPASTANTVTDEPAPAVINSIFHYATLPHALRFTFSQDVSASLSVDDFVIVQLPGNTPVGPEGVTWDPATNTATLTFDNPLDDGRYRVTVLAAGVTNPIGQPLPADHVLEFMFLLGDANNDGVVNLADFNILAANFGQSGPGIDFTQGDFTYDGIVNLADFNLLASRFGASVAPVGFSSRLIGGAVDGKDDQPVLPELA